MNIPIWEDPSNFSLKIKRNLVRKEIIPTFETIYQKLIDEEKENYPYHYDILEKRFLTHQSELPVIWFWSCNKYDIANMSAGNFFQHYASGQDEMQKKIISKIGDRKVLIVGSHSNPPKEGWPSNVKILSTSCQQRLNELADTNIPILEYEALHRYWKQGYVDKKSKEFVHLLHNAFEGWRYWRRLGWFTECHPTKKFVELFASETKNEVEQFLSDNEREQHDRR